MFKNPFKLNWNNSLKPKAVPLAKPQVDPFAGFDTDQMEKKFFNLEKGENFGYDEQGKYFGSDSPLADKQREQYKKFLEEQGWNKFLGDGTV